MENPVVVLRVVRSHVSFEATPDVPRPGTSEFEELCTALEAMILREHTLSMPCHTTWWDAVCAAYGEGNRRFVYVSRSADRQWKYGRIDLDEGLSTPVHVHELHKGRVLVESEGIAL